MTLSGDFFDVADDCEVLRETSGALLVKIPIWTLTVTRWVPKSLLSRESEIRCYRAPYDIRKGGKGILIVKTWWARKEGLHPNEENYVLHVKDKSDERLFRTGK